MKKIALATAVLLICVLAGVLLTSRAPLKNEHAAQRSEGLPALPTQEAPQAPVHADEGSVQDCLASLAVPEGSRALMLQQRRLRVESLIKIQGNPLERETCRGPQRDSARCGTREWPAGKAVLDVQRAHSA